MQEHREVAADRAEAAGLHRFGRLPDDHEVAVAAGDAEQRVADRAAHQVDLEPVHAPDYGVARGHAKGLRGASTTPAMRASSGSALPSRRQS